MKRQDGRETGLRAREINKTEIRAHADHPSGLTRANKTTLKPCGGAGSSLSWLANGNGSDKRGTPAGCGFAAADHIIAGGAAYRSVE